jgi:excisionase family DNA binding protein
MPRTTKKPRRKPAAKSSSASAPSVAGIFGEVLTLAEAAAYLRVKEDDLLKLVGPRDIPARRIGDEWRFSKSALQDWLRAPIRPSSKEALRRAIGSWKDHEDLDELLKEIYRQRGRPMTEEGE